MPEDTPQLVIPDSGFGKKKGFSASEIKRQVETPIGKTPEPEIKKNKTVDIKEKDPQTLTFTESLKEIRRIERDYEKFKKTKKDGDKFPAVEVRRIVDVRKKRDEHLANAEEAGELDEIQECTEPLKVEVEQLEEADSVSSADHKELKGILRGESRDARDYSNDEEAEEREGVGKHYYKQEVSKLAGRLDKITAIEPEKKQVNLDEQILGVLGATMGSVHEAVQALRQEYRLDLPHARVNGEALNDAERNEQRDYVRGQLDVIEKSNRDCMDSAIGVRSRLLETSLDIMDPDIASEVKARLAVHDSSELMRQANGWISRPEHAGPGHTIGSAASEAVRRGHELNETVIDTFLKPGQLEGLRVPEAWDHLQDANFKYKDLVEEVNEAVGESFDTTPTVVSDDERELGMVAANYHTDPNPRRKEAVRQLLIEKLGGDYSAAKSLQLAEKLAIASLETSVFNRTAQAGNDELAEIIGLQGWRKGRREAGRVRGPAIHEDFIKGFGSSWLRRVSNEGLKRRTEHTDQSTNEVPLYAKDVQIDQIKSGDWPAFCTTRVARFNLLRQLLMDRNPEPGKYDKTYLQTAIVYFNEADKPDRGNLDGDLHLKWWWVAGMLDVSLANPESGWTGSDYGTLEKFVTREELGTREDGTSITFISPKMWREITQHTDENWRITKRGAARGIRDSLERTIRGRRR